MKNIDVASDVQKNPHKHQYLLKPKFDSKKKSDLIFTFEDNPDIHIEKWGKKNNAALAKSVTDQFSLGKHCFRNVTGNVYFFWTEMRRETVNNIIVDKSVCESIYVTDGELNIKYVYLWINGVPTRIDKTAYHLDYTIFTMDTIKRNQDENGNACISDRKSKSIIEDEIHSSKRYTTEYE